MSSCFKEWCWRHVEQMAVLVQRMRILITSFLSSLQRDFSLYSEVHISISTCSCFAFRRCLARSLKSTICLSCRVWCLTLFPEGACWVECWHQIVWTKQKYSSHLLLKDHEQLATELQVRNLTNWTNKAELKFHNGVKRKVTGSSQHH